MSDRISDAAVWQFCSAEWKARGHGSDDACLRCPGARVDGRFREACYRISHRTMTAALKAVSDNPVEGV